MWRNVCLLILFKDSKIKRTINSNFINSSWRLWNSLITHGEKQRNGILIVIAFFKLRRMNFTKTWIELHDFLRSSWYKNAHAKNDVFQTIFRNIEIDGKNGSQLFLKFFLCLDISWNTGGQILDETLPMVIRLTLFISSLYQTKRSFICLVYHL